MVSGVYFAIRRAVNFMKEKLVTYVEAELLIALSALAKREGRHILAMAWDAFDGFLAAKQVGSASRRNHVIRAYLLEKRGPLACA